jgi:hypothetical protein
MSFDNFGTACPKKLIWRVKSMKRFIIEHSKEEFSTSTSDPSFARAFPKLIREPRIIRAEALPPSHGIPHADVIRSFAPCLLSGRVILWPSTSTGKMTFSVG